MSSSSQPRVRPAAPRLPERYRLRRHIATGGMAAVWCADDLVLDRRVAIKVLAERFVDDQVAVRRFKREARAAARVATHPHVVTVFDVGDLEPEPGDAGSRAFLVMEYLAGGTVADAIRVGAVRRHESMRWLSEAAAALDHAHARGIVHRDIKPANFLLDRGRVLYVADFGIARLVSEETITTDQLFGTAAYLSPEQALGRPATGASDRYALAVVAFELLAGERPFTAPHFAAQARQHIEDEPPSASARDRTLPEAVDPVIARAMAKDPDERFATAEELVAALRTALIAVPATDRALPRVQAPRRRPVPPAALPTTTRRRPVAAPERPRHRGRVVALACVGALLVAVAGVLAATLASGGTSGTRRAAAAAHARSVAASRSARRSSSRSTAATAPSTSSVAVAQRLQADGHREMLDGDYQSAVGLLRQAVSTSPHDSTTYAYALYDLGRSLMLGGDPTSAIPILQMRLRIPNQTGLVRQLLEQAQRAAGDLPETSTTTTAPTTSTTPTTPTTPAPKAPGPPPGHGRGPSHPRPNGGAGLAPPGHAHGHRVQRYSLVD
jgi:serine/threonine-protein kinase